MDPLSFVAKWKGTQLSERSACQQHFLDLCALVGHPTPADVDKTGESFAFEKGADKHNAGQGWADVWKRGFFGWEYKKPGADLRKAYDQLLLYCQALENPPLLVVSDMDRIEVHTNFTGTRGRVLTLNLDDLGQPEKLALLRAVFFEPESLKPGQTVEAVTAEAAKRVAEIAENLRRRLTTRPPHEEAARGLAEIAKSLRATTDDSPLVARFLDRLVFCMFAEDIGLLPPKLFTDLLQKSRGTPAKFARYLGQLFEAMRDGGDFLLRDVRRFNGNLFADVDVLDLNEAETELLFQAAKLEWGSVDASIFGTLFERGLDPSKRSQLGAHYTSRADIEALVEPVVMVPLRREWDRARRAAQAVLDKEDTRRAREKAASAVSDFLGHLGSVKVLDPACGSGNFLYVTLQKMKDLEKEAVVWATDNGLQPPLPMVHPRQFYGIEVNPYAFDLAQMTLWIGYLQWVRDNGYGTTSDPILESLAGNFFNMDAILDLGNRRGEGAAPTAENTLLKGGSAAPGATGGDVGGSGTPAAMHEPQWPTVDFIIGNPPFLGTKKLREIATGPAAPRDDAEPTDVTARERSDRGSLPPPSYLEPEWPAVDFIVGNPPFLGDKMMRRELGDAYVDALRSLYVGRIPGQSDLCCYWFEKARAAIEAGKCNRAGLLATQGIRGGANREVLKRIKETGDIFFAESDRTWVLDGATVHVSMVGFDSGQEKERSSDAHPVSSIAANLSGGADIGQAKPLEENAGICYLGVMKAGAFDLPWEEGTAMLMEPNPHLRPNSDVLRLRLTGEGVVQRGALAWIIDFGVDSTEEMACQYETPWGHIFSNVKPERERNKRPRLRFRWWIHGEPRPGLRKSQVGLQRFAVTPEVAKHRIFAWLDNGFLADHQTRAFARSDDYFFGVLHSRLHEVWARAQGTQLREATSGCRYTPTTCFETFPFPWPPGKEPQDDPTVRAISEAAAELDRLRRNWLNPPEWVKEEVLEFPGSADGPWARFIVPPGAAGALACHAQAGAPVPPAIGTVRYPRLVPRDEGCASQLKKRTLTNLYNQRPAWLDLAHKKLDGAVATAYGWPPDLTDEGILEHLLALNLERSQE